MELALLPWKIDIDEVNVDCLNIDTTSVKWTSQKLSKRRQKTNIFSELPLTANNEYSRKCDNMTL